MASEIAQSLLQDVVDSVVNSYEFIILLRVKDRPLPQLTLTQAVARQRLDVLDTFEFPSATGPVTLTHLKVIKQHVPNLCGYHSLYNVLETVRFLQLKNEGRKWKVADAPSFWKFHFRTANFLADECVRRGDDHYWKVRNARHGDLERCFLKFLLKTNSHIMQHFQSTADFTSELHTFAFQFNSLPMQRTEILELQASIDTFRATRKECVLSFMMGVTNHWVSLVAHYVNGFREFFFLDSRNRQYLRYDEAQIVEHYEEIQRERVTMGKKPLNDWELTVAHQGVKDIQKSLRILLECLAGTTTLPQVVITDKIDHLLENFQQVPGDSTLEKLECFFQAGFPPKFIYDDYVAPMLSFPRSALAPPSKQRLSTWVHNCDEALRRNFAVTSWDAKYFSQLVIGKLRAYLAPQR